MHALPPRAIFQHRVASTMLCALQVPHCMGQDAPKGRDRAAGDADSIFVGRGRRVCVGLPSQNISTSKS